MAGVDWALGHEKVADGGSHEVVGFFEGAGTGMAAFGTAIADEEAGDVAFNKAIVEVE